MSKTETRIRLKSNGEGSLSVQQRNGKNYYIAQVTVGFDKNGEQIRKTFGGYKRGKVVEKMNAAIYEVNNSIYVIGNEMTFGDFFKEWIFTYKKVELAPRSFELYETSHRLKIEPFPIAKVKLKELKTIQLQKYFNSLLDDEVITPNESRTLLMRIKSCLNFAEEQNLIMRNPAKGVKLPKVIKEDSYNVFSFEEQKKILNTLTDSTVDVLLKLTFATGLRLGEVIALKWSDLADGILSVNRQYIPQYNIKEDGTRTRKYVFSNLKTDKSNREIPLPTNINTMLLEHEAIQLKEIMRVRDVYDDKDLIFADKIGNPIERKRPGRRLSKICKDLKIEHRTFHSIRHSYATRLFELDVPIKTVQELMGHTDMATTMNIYTHVMPEQKEEAVSKLNAMF
ncbi:MAG: site-specific integrase [Tissierellia bacterium]|nr:site-specific integrase [Tissierellia bacterium]